MSARIAMFPSGGARPPRRITDEERRRAQKIIHLTRVRPVGGDLVERIINRLLNDSPGGA